MKNVTFYLLDNDIQKGDLSATEQLACIVVARCWKKGKRVLVSCEDEIQAVRLDKALWAHPVESFVPHNLSGEGTRCGAPVEITWPNKRSGTERDMLISLRVAFVNYDTSFAEVVDFVPHEELLKKLARKRYKAYRLAGFNMKTITWK